MSRLLALTPRGFERRAQAPSYQSCPRVWGLFNKLPQWSVRL